MLIPCRRREGRVIQNMCTYGRRVMNNFVAFVASQEHERVAIGPLRVDMPHNRCLVPNTCAVYSWATR